MRIKVLGLVLSFLIGCNSSEKALDESAYAAREYLEEVISTESNGLLELKNFEVVSSSMVNEKVILVYEYSMSFKEDASKVALAPGAPLWYKDFSVKPGKLELNPLLFMAAPVTFFPKDTVIQLSGSQGLEQKDGQWNITTFNRRK